MKEGRAVLTRGTCTNETAIFTYKSFKFCQMTVDDCVRSRLKPGNGGVLFCKSVQMLREPGPAFKSMRTRNHELSVAEPTTGIVADEVSLCELFNLFNPA